MMDWLVRPLAMTFCGGALGGSSGSDTLETHGHGSSQEALGILEGILFGSAGLLHPIPAPLRGSREL